GLRPGQSTTSAVAGTGDGEQIELGEGSTELQLVALLGEIKQMARARGLEELITSIDEKLAWQRLDLDEAVKAPLYWVMRDGIDALSDLVETLIDARKVS